MTDSPPTKRVKPKPTLNFSAIEGSTSHQLARTEPTQAVVTRNRDSFIGTIQEVIGKHESVLTYADRQPCLDSGAGDHEHSASADDGLTSRLSDLSMANGGNGPRKMDAQGLRDATATVGSRKDTVNGSSEEKKEKLDIKPENLGFLMELGAGNGGSVAKVQYLPTGKICARKVCFASFFQNESFSSIAPG